MSLGALGGRAALLAPAESGGFDLALEGDAFLVRTESDAVDVPGLGRLEAGEARSRPRSKWLCATTAATPRHAQESKWAQALRGPGPGAGSSPT